MRFLILVGVWLCAQAAAAQVPGAGWQPDAATQAQLQASVDSRYRARFSDGQLRAHMSSVDVAALLLDAVAIDHEPVRITQMLSAFLPLLDKNPASRTYGNIRWYQGDPQVVDRNSIEFVTRKAVLVWLLYADRLTLQQQDLLRELLETARIGVPRHSVAISYTNIWLMKTWNLIALGEGLQDEALAANGYRMLSDWLAHTRRTGINEYLSPSYYDVDLESLALIHNLSRNAQARADARAALDLFWHDIALNWYAPAGRLGGTHSRDYNRLFNVGGVNKWVTRAGWEGASGGLLQAGSPYEAVAWASPPEQAEEWLRGPFPRRVSARWGDTPEKRHTHYLGRNFSIASAESGYHAGHDNSPLVINLGSGQDVPIINFFMDGRRDYYGQNKTLEAGSGHMKALHLRPFLTSVQRDNEVLFIASAREDKPEYSALESVLTLPADAEYWLNDQKLDLFTASSRWSWDVGPNQTTTFIEVRQQDGRDEVLITDQDEHLGVGVARLFPVTAGQTYRLGASLQGGETFLYLNYLDAGGRLIGGEHALRVSGGQGGFVWRDFAHQAPPGAVRCKAWLYSTSSNRTVLRVADLRFEELAAGGVRLLGGFDFRTFVPQQIELPAGTTLFVRREGEVAALRLLGAWDVAGAPVGFRLHNDGLAWRALRLTATHSPARTNQRASIAVWAWAGEGFADAQRFARLRGELQAQPGEARLNGNLVEARSGAGERALQLQADPAAGRRLLRQGHSAEPVEAALSVNGQALEPVSGQPLHP